MRTRVLNATQQAEAGASWTRIEGELATVAAMSSWDWTRTWLAHYGEVVRHRFILTEDDDGPRGIALVAEQAALGRLRPPTLALGTAGEPPGSSVFLERNALLASPEDRAPFAAALMAELEGDASWQRLRLDGVLPADGELLLDGRANARRRVEQSPLTELPAGADTDVLEALPARKRQRVQQALRHFGALETQWAQNAAEAHAILDELIALHESRWQAEGQPGAFANPRFSAFHRELIATLMPSGRAALFRVRRGGETIGCLYGLVEGPRLLFYQGGLRRFEDNRLRTGLAAHALFMQACRDRGFSHYDFLAPAARYKSDLATGSEELLWAEIERPKARLRFERAARAVRQRLRSGDA